MYIHPKVHVWEQFSPPKMMAYYGQARASLYLFYPLSLSTINAIGQNLSMDGVFNIYKFCATALMFCTVFFTPDAEIMYLFCYNNSACCEIIHCLYHCNHFTIWRDLMMCVGCHQAKLCDFIQVRSTGQFRETRPADLRGARPDLIFVIFSPHKFRTKTA